MPIDVRKATLPQLVEMARDVGREEGAAEERRLRPVPLSPASP